MLLIGDDMIECTSARAFAAPTETGGRWVVSWMNGVGEPTVSRNQAVTAITLAAHIATHDGGNCDQTCRRWPFVENWASELGMAATDVVQAVKATERFGES